MPGMPRKLPGSGFHARGFSGPAFPRLAASASFPVRAAEIGGGSNIFTTVEFKTGQ